ncbi:MAG: DUF4386 domain-containing protein [Candidatus Kapabacteria bacterium]|jgi:hypothetical protein|nr:DUF4386 domain-containing protein [Candidatus Kapabacteria bacterium]
MLTSLPSRKNTARYAGLLYLLMALTAAFSLMTMPSSVVVKGNALKTAQNLVAQETTVRWVIVSHLVCHSIFLMLAMTFYRLFKSVNDHWARLLVLFVAVQVPLIFVGEALNYTALMAATGEFLTMFSMPEKADIVMLLEQVRSKLLLTAQVFWGLWLIPLGQLSFASGFMPRVLGIVLIAGGIAYLVQTALNIAFPMWYAPLVVFVNPIHTIAEISMILWLLIMGTTDKNSSSHT